MKLQIINGPNLNLIGQREKSIYGVMSFDDYLHYLLKKYSTLSIDYFQSNIEGEIIDRLHHVGFKSDGIILNAAAYTHTSVGIADAVRSVKATTIEVHISNTISREDYRHISYIAPHAKGIIMGFGLYSYDLAISSFIKKL